MKSTVPRSSNKLHGLGIEEGHQDSSPSTGPQDDTLQSFLVLNTGYLDHRQTYRCITASGHHGDVKWPSCRRQLPFSRAFVQQFVQTDNKETSKVRVTVPLWGDSPHKWTVTRKTFPFEDVIMHTSIEQILVNSLATGRCGCNVELTNLNSCQS